MVVRCVVVVVVVMMVVTEAGTTRFGWRPLTNVTPEEIEKGRNLPDSPPVATSTYHLTELLQQEVQVVTRLRELADELMTAHQACRSNYTHLYLTSWDELERGGARSAEFVYHPLHAYALTKHLSLRWPPLQEATRRLHNHSHHIEWILGREASAVRELDMLAAGVARLHDYYSLNLTALTQSNLISLLSSQPIPITIPVSVSDLNYIGSRAAAANIWNSGVDFLGVALKLSLENTSLQQPHSSDTLEPQHQLATMFNRTVQMHDQLLERKGRRSKYHSAHPLPINTTLAKKRKYHKRVKEKWEEAVVLGRAGTQLQGIEQSMTLCRGHDIRPVNITSHLYCRYINNGSPLYLIGPLRMEVVSLVPYIVTLQGVVTSREAQDIKVTSSAFLEASSTVRFNGGKEISYQRTSSTYSRRCRLQASRSPTIWIWIFGAFAEIVHRAWLYEHNNNHLKQLTTRIETLLGVSAQEHVSAEAYQVVNYGAGGHYTVHHDTLTVPYLAHLRIATFLVYLSDVPQGGWTVFPWLGVGVAPKQGSALLWYNVNRAGVKDERVYHAACPVLFGDKWVINKWLHYGGQTLKVPCLPDSQSHIALPLN
ncbi:hypothetical protein Pcinc_003616 [Petrolisthes cinctipes]|uniref:procollagen-proline 4-dioxygenase n=1 Tax=Petrolisthes cinctipes TaxID=88211 RepID=A0AAE1L4I7_PETCI|nr:hypothetical protein Pcinc_003616 [Petrolisthes cinctipes]